MSKNYRIPKSLSLQYKHRDLPCNLLCSYKPFHKTDLPILLLFVPTFLLSLIIGHQCHHKSCLCHYYSSSAIVRVNNRYSMLSSGSSKGCHQGFAGSLKGLCQFSQKLSHGQERSSDEEENRKSHQLSSFTICFSHPKCQHGKLPDLLFCLLSALTFHHKILSKYHSCKVIKVGVWSEWLVNSLNPLLSMRVTSTSTFAIVNLLVFV